MLRGFSADSAEKRRNSGSIGEAKRLILLRRDLFLCIATIYCSKQQPRSPYRIPCMEHTCYFNSIGVSLKQGEEDAEV